MMVGLEKPIFNPREPSSLAQVGISPLTGAGNLWLWLPQVRFEQDFSFTQLAPECARRWASCRRAKSVRIAGSSFTARWKPRGPALEGRFEFFHNLDDERRMEIAPGFHTQHDPRRRAIASLPTCSRWTGFSIRGSGWNSPARSTPARTWRRWATESRQGYPGIRPDGASRLHSSGGWGQFTIHAAPRLDFHLFTGQQDDTDQRSERRAASARTCCTAATSTSAWRRMCCWAWKRRRCGRRIIGQGVRINNHYDLALAYHF